MTNARKCTCAAMVMALSIISPWPFLSQAKGLIASELTVVSAVPNVGTFLVGGALSPDGRTLYVVDLGTESSNNRGAISVIDTSTAQVSTRIQLAVGFPAGIAVTPDGQRAYVAVSKFSGATTSTGSNRIEVIDTTTNSLQVPIAIGGTPGGPTKIAITPDGTRAYVTHRQDRRVVVIDIDSGSLTFNHEVASIPTTVCTGIALTPDGRRAYVANRGAPVDGSGPPRVDVVDTDPASPTFNSVIATLDPTIGPSGDTAEVAITRDGSRAYVTYRGDGRIAVIDTTLNQVAQVITSRASNLGGISLSPDSTLAYVTAVDLKQLLVIDIDPSSPTFHKEIGAVSLGVSPYNVISSSLGRVVAYVLGDGTVSAIGGLAGNQCYGDFNGDNQVTVDEIITAVNNALSTCQPPQTLARQYTGQGQEILSGECISATGFALTIQGATVNIASQNGPAFSGTYAGQAATGSFTLQINGTIDAAGNFTSGVLAGDMGQGHLVGSFGGRLVGDVAVVNYSGLAGGCRVAGSVVATKVAQ